MKSIRFESRGACLKLLREDIPGSVGIGMSYCDSEGAKRRVGIPLGKDEIKAMHNFLGEILIAGDGLNG